MKIKGSLEQAVCILLFIAHTPGHAPVKSYTLSERLGLSDSYLKKIMRQLVVSELVDSESGKNGGFILKKAPENISLLDVFEAIEGDGSFLSTTNLVDKVFPDKKELAHEKESQIVSVFTQAEQAYKRQLSQFTLQHAVVENLADW
ncbi:RrF2 family transcriptional regulator [Anaerostipes sp.]|uniref:RrF2 family transcriptional regulator n=1 Tax=Anaerostipes sp. TaxID=1872530 RepID=UPI0025BEB4D0|nr:Rrf2 family transcriptional regulator [Anaerostipes sp.]MBS7009560.1 Rrf2 family transcriptional regulator [Anaerostipes sp.]